MRYSQASRTSSKGQDHLQLSSIHILDPNPNGKAFKNDRCGVEGNEAFIAFLEMAEENIK